MPWLKKLFVTIPQASPNCFDSSHLTGIAELPFNFAHGTSTASRARSARCATRERRSVRFAHASETTVYFSFLHLHSKRGLVCPKPRASNEGLPRPRVARARGQSSHSCISIFSPRRMTNSKLTPWHSDCFGVPDRYRSRLHAHRVTEG